MATMAPLRGAVVSLDAPVIWTVVDELAQYRLSEVSVTYFRRS